MKNKVRAKNLTDDSIEEIVAILDAWRGELTWNAYVHGIQQRTGCLYTRQALFNHIRIREAFQARKKQGPSEKLRSEATAKNSELRAAEERLDVLEQENKRLTRENNALLEQFRRWLFNARGRISIDELNTPLHDLDRRQTPRREP